MTHIFSTDIGKIFKTLNFMEVRPVRSEFFHADRQTDGHDEVNNSFWQILRKHLKTTALIRRNVCVKQLDVSYSRHVSLS